MTTKNSWNLLGERGQELAEEIMNVVRENVPSDDVIHGHVMDIYASAMAGQPIFAQMAIIAACVEHLASLGSDFLVALPDEELKKGFGRFVRATNALPVPATPAAIEKEHPERASAIIRRLGSGSLASSWREAHPRRGIDSLAWWRSVSPSMVFKRCWEGFISPGVFSMEYRDALAKLVDAKGLGRWADAFAQGVGREAARFSVKEALELCKYRDGAEWDAALAVLSRCDREDLEAFMREQEIGFAKDAKTAGLALAAKEPSELSGMSAMSRALFAGAQKSASKAKIENPSLERALATMIDPRRMLVACSAHSAEAMPWWRAHLSATISAMVAADYKNGRCDAAFQMAEAIGAVSESFEIANSLPQPSEQAPARGAPRRI